MAALLAAALAAPACSWVGDGDEADKSFTPLFDGGPATLAEVCAADSCVGDIVQLPAATPIDVAVDLPLPETLGYVAVERVWTGHRGRLFGPGWESIWDLHIDDGVVTGPLPATPLGAVVDGAVTLSDGTSMQFGSDGELNEVCPDDASCSIAQRSADELSIFVEGRTEPIVVYTLTADGTVASARTADGRTASYQYQDGLLVAVTGAEGEPRYSYDDGRLSRVEASGTERSFVYDGGDLIEAVDRSGESWRLERQGDEGIDVVVAGSSTSYVFEGPSLVSVTNPDGQVVLERQWDNGVMIAERRPLDGVTFERVADSTYRVTTSNDVTPDRVATYRLDELGRIVESEAAGETVTTTYVGLGHRPASTTRNGAESVFTYDENGRLTGVVDADGYTVSLTLDDAGLPIEVSDGVQRTTFEYDDAGRPVAEAAGSSETQATYDSSGRLATLALPGQEAWKVVYDTTGQLDLGGPVPEAEPEAEPGLDAGLDGVDVEYDEWGRPTEVTTGGRTTTRSYDQRGRLEQLVMADGTQYDLSYTAAGRLRRISDAELDVDLTWHGDLLTSATTSAGSQYTYSYGPDGRLQTAQLGDATWSYTYSASGSVEQVRTPVGLVDYVWDEFGRPVSRQVSGRKDQFSWIGNDLQLDEAEVDGEVVVDAEWDDGTVVGFTTPDVDIEVEYDDGDVRRYEVEGQSPVDVTYVDGRIETIASDGHTETWSWKEDATSVSEVSIGDEQYELAWLLPGLLGRVTNDGEVLLTVEADSGGLPAEVYDDVEEPLASVAWERGGATSIATGDVLIGVDRDVEYRVEHVDVDDLQLDWSYVDGNVREVSTPTADFTSTLRDGSLSSTRLGSVDDWAEVTWSEQGDRPRTFVTSKGSGSFAYGADGRVEAIAYDDHVREVTYDDDQPRAEGSGQEFLDALFSDGGEFRAFDVSIEESPPAPWFEALPAELGMALPTVTTGTDLIEAALDLATPKLPQFLLGNPDDIAETTADTVVALASKLSVPLDPGRQMTLDLTAGALDEALLAFSPSVAIASTTWDTLADGPCLLCRIGNAAVGLAGAVGDGLLAAARLVVDNPVAQFIAGAAFAVGGLFGASVCAGTVVCGAVVAAIFAGSVLFNALDVGLVNAIRAATIDPLLFLASGVVSADPVAIATVAALVAAAYISRTSAPLGVTARLSDTSRVCRLNRVVCVSTSRYGAAGTHVADAQRSGAARILRIDRAGASARRDSALSGLPTRLGFDRDEYPFAVSSQRRGLSIRYIDPASNRSLGWFVGQQLSPLPDGARFLVLPVR
ncbi:MAG: hypothetical protein KDB37_11765 [Ilumatobacter sp.]|nr:hypothetical protein [Ilumatobacter sp.]